MRKCCVLANPKSCLNKAAMDEPLFVLRANDPVAAAVVEMWAGLAAEHHEHGKVAEAYEVAKQMRIWRQAHVEGYRVGDEHPAIHLQEEHQHGNPEVQLELVKS